MGLRFSFGRPVGASDFGSSFPGASAPGYFRNAPLGRVRKTMSPSDATRKPEFSDIWFRRMAIASERVATLPEK